MKNLRKARRILSGLGAACFSFAGLGLLVSPSGSWIGSATAFAVAYGFHKAGTGSSNED